MNLKKIGFILFVLLLLPFTIKVFGANNFGQTQSLFTDIKANSTGDILTVLIFEQSRATQKAEAKTSKSTKASVSGGPGIGPLRFIPIFGADGQNDATFDGKGESIRNGTFSAKMSVTVVAVKESGDLIDAIKSDRIELGNVKEAELPEEMQKMNMAERKEYLEQKAKEREEIRNKINELSKKRAEYIAQEMKIPAQIGNVLQAVDAAGLNNVDKRDSKIAWATAFGLSLCSN